MGPAWALFREGAGAAAAALAGVSGLGAVALAVPAVIAVAARIDIAKPVSRAGYERMAGIVVS